MSEAAAVAVSFCQWRWSATLDRPIAVNSREPRVVARFTLPEISSDILERKAALLWGQHYAAEFAESVVDFVP